MDLDARYQTLCAELGHLDMEIEIREKRRGILRAEIDVLRRIAVDIARAKPPVINNMFTPKDEG